MGDQDSRDTGSVLPELHRVGAQVGNPIQCYCSAEEGTTTLRAALAVVEHNRPGFESHRQQLHWSRLTAQAHEAALLQFNALAASLCNSADKLSLEADSTVTRLPALIRRLHNKCCRDSLEKDAHRSWWKTMVTLSQAAQRRGQSWPESHDRAIREVADSWAHPDWLVVLENLRYIRDHLEGPPDRYSRPYKLQQVAWHNQSKVGADLIMDMSNVRWYLPEGFSQCSPTAYSLSTIIELAEFLYIQPAPADPADLSRVATNLRQILHFVGPPAASCNFINTMREGFPSYSLVMSFEDAFRTWEGKLIPHLSEWRPIKTSSMSLRPAAQGHTFQSTIHSPAWMNLVHRSRSRGLVSRKGLHNFQWDLLSMAVSQVEPTLKPYENYLPPLNSHRVQDAPLNNLDEVHKWMQLHRLAATDDRECGNLEFLCTLNTPSLKRMRYLLHLCKD